MNATFVLRGESMLPLTTAWLGASVPLYAAIVALNDGETPAPLQTAQECANELFCLAVHRGAPVEILNELVSVRFDNMAVDVLASARTRTLRPNTPLQIAAQQSHLHALEFLISRCERITAIKSEVVESALESSVSADAVRQCLTRLFASPKLVDSARQLQVAYMTKLLKNAVACDIDTLQLLYDAQPADLRSSDALNAQACSMLLGRSVALPCAFFERYLFLASVGERKLASVDHACHEAVHCENLELIRAMLASAAVREVRGSRVAQSLLMYALTKKRARVIDLVFQDVPSRFEGVRMYRESLVYALEMGRVDVARFCIESSGEDGRKWGRDSGDAKDLLVASAANAAAIDLLVDFYGASFNRGSVAKVLGIVARKGNVVGVQRLVELLDEGANRTSVEDKSRALMSAVASNQDECARVLINMGARLYDSNWYVVTKLAEWNNVALLELALSKEQSIPAPILSTALELAGEFSAMQTADLLLRRGVLLECKHWVACATGNKTNMLQFFQSRQPIAREWRQVACQAALARRSFRAALWLQWEHFLDVLIAWHKFEMPIHVQLQILLLLPEFRGIIDSKQLPTIARVRAFQVSSRYQEQQQQVE
jgi:ankyrin repeat protein